MIGTAPLYFFSPRHEERAVRRNCLKNHPPLPVNPCNAGKWDTRQWVPPPYKTRYANREFIYDKPLLIVSNKYNSEWTRPPINFLSLAMLEFIHERFSKKYQIVYSRYTFQDDNSVVYDLGDFELVRRKFSGTILMQDLMAQKRISWNELQMKLYANCERFISVQGGPAVISSYFGGDNCIYIRKGFELTSGEYEKVYPLLSGCRTRRVAHRAEDLETEETRFIRALKVPTIRRSIEEPFKELLGSIF